MYACMVRSLLAFKKKKKKKNLPQRKVHQANEEMDGESNAGRITRLGDVMPAFTYNKLT